MLHNDIISKALNITREQLSGDCTGHDEWHAERVWHLAKHIASKETCNTLIVELSAILHDIDDWKFNGGNTEAGGDKAKQILIDLGADKEIAQKVKQIINEISFKGANVVEPSLSIEAMIVQDADRLDAMGAIGIARAFACGSHFKQKIHNPHLSPKQHNSFEEYKQKKTTSINHFHEKLLLLQDRMNTNTAKEIAIEKHQFMEIFLAQFMSEWRQALPHEHSVQV